MSVSSKPVFLHRGSAPHIATLIIVASLQAMAMNMFLPSLPQMTEYFQTTYGIMQLSVGIFLAGSAVMQILIGPFSDRFGRRPVLLGGIAIYTLATLGCIYAPTAELFLVGRVVQAAASVGMVLSRTIVRDLFPANRAASVIGYVTMAMSVAPMLTPALGGYLTEHFNWQATFWVLFATGILVFALVYFDLGETNTTQSESFRAQFQEYPELLKSQRFWGYSLASAFSAGAFFAYLGGAPYVATEFFHMSPATMGYLIGAPGWGYMVGNFVSGRYSTRLGINKMVLYGALIATAGVLASLLLTLSGLSSPTTFFGFFTFLGLGNGMLLANSTSGMMSVRPRLAGTASGLGGAMMIGGGAGLSALAGNLLKHGHGPEPLLWIMLVVLILSILAIWWVIARERRIGIV